ncbi:MAG: hypothetical protein ACYTEX_04860 [Planctomycetota bacterium]
MPTVVVPLFSPYSDRYLGFLAISFFLGLVLAGLQQEILAKPFSFCLPGHRQVPRRILFYIGGVVNALFGLVFLACSGIALPYALLVIAAAGFAGMVLYFWGMYVSFGGKPNPVATISIPLIVVGVLFFQFDRAIQYIIISSPAYMIAAGALTCIWVWKWLGRDALHRRYCGKLIVNDSFGAWNRPKAQRFLLARTYTKPARMRAAISQSLDTSFTTAIANHALLGRTRHILAAAYVLAARVLATYRLKSLLGLLSLVLFFVVYFGYMPAPGITGLLYIFCAFPLIGSRLFPHPTLLLPEGRSEKYCRAIASAVITACVGALLLIIVTALSVYLEDVLSPITFKGRTFTYHGMGIGQFYNFLLFAPIALALTLIFRRNFLWRMVAFVVLMHFWAALAIAVKLTQILALGPLPIIALVLLVWLLFLLLLHRHCTKKPLVGQTRQY